MMSPKIAVLLPCYNEQKSIAKVIADFQEALPEAAIYVFDNNSKDQTVEVASSAGAIVRQESRQGKGHVVRRMFADVEADVYVMADGDATYQASAAPEMIQALIENKLDMVTGIRKEVASKTEAYRKGHRFGNQMFNKLVQFCFGSGFTDIFSGYRVFSRRFVKSFAADSAGFDIETEITIHSLEQRLPCMEIETEYVGRLEGSFSKLNKYKDGLLILWRVIMLLKLARPLLFFSIIAVIFALFAFALFAPVFVSYLETGLVQRFPTAFLSLGLIILAFMSLLLGLILDGVSKNRRENIRLHYLKIPYPDIRGS